MPRAGSSSTPHSGDQPRAEAERAIILGLSAISNLVGPQVQDPGGSYAEVAH